MSVSQVKKRFAEMESYLGRDKEALRRLKLLKDDVNVLRTSLAAAEEKAVEAEAVKEAARKRADHAEQEARMADAKALENESRLLAAESRVSLLKEQLEQAFSEKAKQTIEPVDKEASLKRMIKALRKKMAFCPLSPRNGGKITNDTMWFNRDELATGYSHDEIWKLGASVAALVLFRGQIVLYAEETATDIVTKQRVGSFIKPLVQWFSKNIRKDGVDEMWKSLSEEQRQKAELQGRQQDTEFAMFGTQIEE